MKCPDKASTFMDFKSVLLFGICLLVFVGHIADAATTDVVNMPYDRAKNAPNCKCKDKICKCVRWKYRISQGVNTLSPEDRIVIRRRRRRERTTPEPAPAPHQNQSDPWNNMVYPNISWFLPSDSGNWFQEFFFVTPSPNAAGGSRTAYSSYNTNDQTTSGTSKHQGLQPLPQFNFPPMPQFPNLPPLPQLPNLPPLPQLPKLPPMPQLPNLPPLPQLPNWPSMSQLTNMTSVQTSKGTFSSSNMGGNSILTSSLNGTNSNDDNTDGNGLFSSLFSFKRRRR